MALSTMSATTKNRRSGAHLIAPSRSSVASVLCCGGGGTSTSASGVGTWAASWTGVAQFGQKRSVSRNLLPQFRQYLFGMVMLPLSTLDAFSLAVGCHPRYRDTMSTGRLEG